MLLQEERKKMAHPKENGVAVSLNHLSQDFGTPANAFHALLEKGVGSIQKTVTSVFIFLFKPFQHNLFGPLGLFYQE